jgi:predicted small lipoprotein YifL
MKLSIIVMLGTALAACGASGPVSRPTPVPAAVSTLIQQLETQPPADPPLYVASYEYRGQVVYYVPPRCCDIFSDLYSASGDLLCHPDGGLAGHGDGRCSDFLRQRKNETIIWRDRR